MNFNETLVGIKFHGPSPKERGLGVRPIPVRFSLSSSDNSDKLYSTETT